MGLTHLETRYAVYVVCKLWCVYTIIQFISASLRFRVLVGILLYSYPLYLTEILISIPFYWWTWLHKETGITTYPWPFPSFLQSTLALTCQLEIFSIVAPFERLQCVLTPDVNTSKRIWFLSYFYLFSHGGEDLIVTPYAQVSRGLISTFDSILVYLHLSIISTYCESTGCKLYCPVYWYRTMNAL